MGVLSLDLIKFSVELFCLDQQLRFFVDNYWHLACRVTFAFARELTEGWVELLLDRLFGLFRLFSFLGQFVDYVRRHC